MRIFISYARLNKSRVEELQKILTRAGHDAWFDQEISGGEEWWQSITNSIKSCDIFLFALTPESTNSDACRAEFQYAVDLNKPILPVMLAPADLPIGKLQMYQYVDAKNLRSNDTLLELNRALNRLSDRIRAGEFSPPDPYPPDPAFPFPPDPLEDIRSKVSNLRGLPEEELLKIVYRIQQVSRTSQRTSNEARKLLQVIASDNSLPYGVVELAKAAMASFPATRRVTPQFLLIAGVLLTVILPATFFLVQRLLLPDGNDAVETTTVAGVVTAASSTDVMTDETTDALTMSVSSSAGTSTPTPTPTERLTETDTGTRTAGPTQTQTATHTISQTVTDVPTASATLSARQVLLLTQTASAPTVTLTPVDSDTPSGSESPGTESQVITALNARLLVETGDPLTGHNSTIQTLAFSPDGMMFASGSSDFTVRVWETATTRMIWRIAEHRDWVTGVAFSPNGNLLATASRDGTLILWNTDTREQISRSSHSGIWEIDFSPDSTLLALARENGTTDIVDVATVRTLITLRGHRGRVLTVDFNLDGSQILTGGIDGTLHVYEVTTGEELLKLANINDPQILTASFGLNDEIIVSGSNSGSARVWDLETGSTLAEFTSTTIWGVAFLHDKDLVAVASADGDVYLWNWKSDETLFMLNGHRGAIRSLAVSPDGTLIVSGGEEGDNTIRVWGLPAQ